MTETKMIDPYEKWHRGYLYIDRELTFYQNKSFRFWAGLPIILAVVSYLAMFCGPDSPWDYDFTFSAGGYSQAINLIKFPLYLISIAGALGVFVSRMHRSKVINKSIDVAERNNNFMQRAKHEEEFVRCAREIKPQNIVTGIARLEISIKDAHALYRTFFPKNTLTINNLTSGASTGRNLLIKICQDMECDLLEVKDERLMSVSSIIDTSAEFLPLEVKLYLGGEGHWTPATPEELISANITILEFPNLLKAIEKIIRPCQSFMASGYKKNSLDSLTVIKDYAPTIWEYHKEG